MLLAPRDGGFILITILIFFVLLVSLAAAFLFFATIELRQAANNLSDVKALAISEAGLERGIREIRDEELAAPQISNPSQRNYCPRISLDGYQATGISVTNSSRACFYGNTFGSTSAYYATLSTAQGSNVIVYDFQQRFNLWASSIKEIRVICRARKNSSGGRNPTLQLRYTFNGSAGSPTWYTIDERQISSTAWSAPYYVTIDAPDPIPNWANIMDSDNFRVQAYHSSSSDNRTIYIDYLAIEVSLAVDASSEPWYAGFSDISLGDGVIESIDIRDEAGKVHLNYASQALLNYLMQECAIPASVANTIAASIVNYRTTSKMFDSIEELKAVPGMTQAYYDAVKDYITVWPWVNDNVNRPAGARSPVNINTACELVLEAVLDPLGLPSGSGVLDESNNNYPNRIARAIIAARATTPFSAICTTNPDTLGDLYDFLVGQTYLSSARRNTILENADASLYNRTLSASWNNNDEVSSEFCFYTDTFSLQSRGSQSGSSRLTATVIKKNGNKYLDTYIDDTAAKRYWREIR